MSSIPEIILNNAEILYEGGALQKEKYDRICEEMQEIIRKETMSPQEFVGIREKLKLSRSELGMELGVSTSTISKWESGVNQIPKAYKRLMEIWGKQGLSLS